MNEQISLGQRSELLVEQMSVTSWPELVTGMMLSELSFKLDSYISQLKNSKNEVFERV